MNLALISRKKKIQIAKNVAEVERGLRKLEDSFQGDDTMLTNINQNGDMHKRKKEEEDKET